MLSNKPVKENDESNPCIEISDIKYEIFTVRREKVSCNGHTPVDANLHPVHQMFGKNSAYSSLMKSQNSHEECMFNLACVEQNFRCSLSLILNFYFNLVHSLTVHLNLSR